jgi:hypothetical protein
MLLPSRSHKQCLNVRTCVAVNPYNDRKYVMFSTYNNNPTDNQDRFQVVHIFCLRVRNGLLLNWKRRINQDGMRGEGEWWTSSDVSSAVFDNLSGLLQLCFISFYSGSKPPSSSEWLLLVNRLCYRQNHKAVPGGWEVGGGQNTYYYRLEQLTCNANNFVHNITTI